MNYDQIKQYVEAAYTAPGWAWAIGMTFIACTIWRKLPEKLTFWKFTLHFPNEVLWLVCLAVAIPITVELAPSAPANFDAHKWRLVNIMLGVAVGFVTKILYNIILGKLEALFPPLKKVVEGADNTEFFVKPPDPPKSG